MDSHRKLKILIVDDSLLNLRIIAAAIERNGYETVLASRVDQVFQYISKETPDLILLDVIMPQMNGYEVCKLLKNDNKTKDIPIIFITTQAGISDIAKGFEVGAVDYINKPFHELELISRVKNHLQLKELHDQLRKSNEELQKTNTELIKANETIQYNKIQQEFFTNLSHELKTPLNLIFSTVQLMESNMKNKLILSNEQAKRYGKSLKQNSYRMLRLVNNLIDITKMDSGYFQLNLQNYNIVSIVEDITLSVANYIENHHINLIFDTTVEEKIIAVDADAIERIMLNLLSNAVKFTKQGNLIIIKIYDLGESIAISVKDTGIGIPRDKLRVIFDRFRQVDKTLTRNHEGSGIGLSIVKALVEMHNGEITVKSEYGTGSEFIIKLPVRVLEKEDHEIQTDHYSDKDSYIASISVEFSDIYSIS